ncbi:MAG TPA: hypothetical protein VG406_26250 [Isosphaeraceae bacterium]|jgi:hypothetical protein|nr:hypothetical protein [Isosphaeraceae bacterium]
MTCRDFEHAWHDRLDGRGPVAPALAKIEAHAARCPSCRERGRRFEALHLAILSLGPPPAAPASLAARIAARAQAEAAAEPRSYSFKIMYVRLAVAAAVLLALGIGLYGMRSPGRNVARLPRPAPVGRPAIPLGSAMAVATSATVDLAREAGAPAARVGLRALDAAPIPAAPAVGEVPVDPAARVIETVGAGVRPLSGSARHAFAFLIRPAPGPRPRSRPTPARTPPQSE